MKKFELTATVTISVYTTVNAENIKDAIEIAESRGIEHSDFGYQNQEYEAWVSDEYDGFPQNIRTA
jgi:hypothetical protein